MEEILNRKADENNNFEKSTKHKNILSIQDYKNYY